VGLQGALMQKSAGSAGQRLSRSPPGWRPVTGARRGRLPWVESAYPR